MQEDRAAASGDSRGGVVVDLDDEIVQVIVAPEAVPVAAEAYSHRLIIMPVGRVLSPGILGTNRLDGQQGPGPRMAVRAPP